jgi:hypothetical protein
MLVALNFSRKCGGLFHRLPIEYAYDLWGSDWATENSIKNFWQTALNYYLGIRLLVVADQATVYIATDLASRLNAAVRFRLRPVPGVKTQKTEIRKGYK